MDNRRRQWVPISSQIAFSGTGTKLLAKWGAEGLLTWVLYLAACKREIVQGEFTYSSEAEGWMKLGAKPVHFSLEEFFTYTGRLKKTRKTVVGRVNYVICRDWDEWKVKPSSKQNGSKQATNTEEIEQSTNGIERPYSDSDSDLIPMTETEETLASAKRVFDHWKGTRGKKQARLTQGRVKKIRARLKTFSEADLLRAVDAVSLDPWEDRSRYDDLGEHILRSDEQVEKWLSLSGDVTVLSPEQRRERHLQSLKERGVA